MPAIAASEIIHPKQLSAEERQQLIDALYAVHCEIFDGVERAAFAKYVVESKADHTIIRVHKSAEERIVGYCAIHIFEKELGGRPVAVIRMEAGSLREYRGGNSNVRFCTNYILRYWLANLRRRLYYLGTLVHPSSYMLFAKYTDEVLPSRERPLAPSQQALMAEMARAFELEPVDAARPLVVHVGWRTRDTEVERAYWRTCPKPTARFFVQENPSYGEGHGLMTLVPISGRTLLRSGRRVTRDKLQRRIELTLSSLQRLPLVRRFLAPQIIQRRLRQTALFADIPAADLRELAQAAEVIALPAGSYVFHDGDAGNELYIVASGSVYVIDEDRTEDEIIDQLAVGALFGEMAVLSNEPRMAAVRTATRATLIRIHRRPLFALMERHAAMRTAIWAAFDSRRFNEVVSATPRLAHLDRQQRADWFAQGQREELAPQQSITLADSWTLLLTGSAEISQGELCLSVRAPALIRAAAPLELVAQAASRIVRLPLAAHEWPLPSDTATAGVVA